MLKDRAMRLFTARMLVMQIAALSCVAAPADNLPLANPTADELVQRVKAWSEEFRSFKGTYHFRQQLSQGNGPNELFIEYRFEGQNK